MSTQLLPCPFCGGPAKVTHHLGNEVWNQSWICGCVRCNQYFSESGSNSWAQGEAARKLDRDAEAKAIVKWNTRTEVTKA